MTITRSYVFNQRTDKCYLALVTISHNSFSPIRVVNNTENITTNQGNVFKWFPFEINMPGDGGDDIQKVELTIQDPTREITTKIEELTTAPDITLSLITADNPDEDDPEDGPYEMVLKNCSWDSITVSGELGYPEIWEEPYPGDSFTPLEYPGLF